jgi:HAD superfamily hydrolase (TIGR01509 family)
MIKLIIFDLDGVLIESKDLHYDSLNMALEECGHDIISYEDHIARFDGNPTKVKLSMLGIDDESEKNNINNRKQFFTTDLLEKMVSKSDKFVDLFIKLKNDGYSIAVASNSVRYTIFLVLFKLGIMRHVDCIVSNQDVSCGKPNPEMYLKCMTSLGYGPRETLILEDSYVGRQGAFNSGAYLCPILNPSEVTYEYIKITINKYKGYKQKWKGCNMNILIPMAGEGSRFSKAGFTFPKPLIEVNGKPMIQAVVENINIDAQYIYIVRTDQYEKYNLKYMLEMISPNCKIVKVDSLTEGAACTTLLAKEYIDNEEQLLIANSDQWIDWDSSDFMYSMQGDNIDGGILTFENTHPKWSYVKMENGVVSEVAEKKVISNQATVGIYHWKKGSDYVRYAEDMIEKDIRVNGEFYVAPVYNEAIEDDKKFKIYEVNSMYGLGTPEDLDIFLKNNSK